MNLNLGIRVHFSPEKRAPYAELGGGTSLVLDRPDDKYGGLLGGMAGAGYQLSSRRSIGARLIWAPLYGEAKGAHAVSAMVMLQVR